MKNALLGLIHVSPPGNRLFLQRLFQASDQSAGGAAGVSARVLVVEDEYLVAMGIEDTLLDAGFAVVGIAASADEALRIARSERPDLAVMDIRLVGRRDGIEAAIEIFNETGIRCIFATAHGDASTRHRAEAAQPLGWLTKPYAPETLVQAVRSALSGLRGK